MGVRFFVVVDFCFKLCVCWGIELRLSGLAASALTD